MAKVKSRKRKQIPTILKNNEPALSMVCEEVKEGEDISEITQALLYNLTKHKHGVGLAANQVGILKRVIVVKIGGNYKIMVNPSFCSVPAESDDNGEIIPATEVQYEGCLSYPGVLKQVCRELHIQVDYTNEQGERSLEKYNDLAARIIQHEIDHLNGKCILKGI